MTVGPVALQATCLLEPLVAAWRTSPVRATVDNEQALVMRSEGAADAAGVLATAKDSIPGMRQQLAGVLTSVEI